jgi:ParB-like chromosome segregation protein Spo0J
MKDGKLQTVWVPIGDVRPHPRNVRQGDIGAISQSIKAHGQYRPIVVQRSTGHILAGNHTWKAAKALKCVQVAVTYLDVDDDEAVRIMLIDNRTSDHATYDDDQLAGLLAELSKTPAGFEGTGYSGDDVDDLLRLLGLMAGEKPIKDGRTEREPNEIVCPECGHVIA